MYQPSLLRKQTKKCVYNTNLCIQPSTSDALSIHHTPSILGVFEVFGTANARSIASIDGRNTSSTGIMSSKLAAEIPRVLGVRAVQHPDYKRYPQYKLLKYCMHSDFEQY